MAISFSASDYELAGVMGRHGGIPALPRRPPIFGCVGAAGAADEDEQRVPAPTAAGRPRGAHFGRTKSTLVIGPSASVPSSDWSGSATGGGAASGVSLRHRKALRKQTDRGRPSRATGDDDRSSRASTNLEYVDRSLTKYIQVELLGGMLKSGTFRGLVLAVITMNSVLVGLQTDVGIEREYAALFFVLDFIFLTFFTVEIVLKWLADFYGFWRVGWNVFDFLIVFISLAGQGLSFMSGGRVLRTLRVLRAFRTIKSIRMVRGLQMIVSTVFRSLPDMGNIFMLLGIVMFIFAVAGVNIFGHDLPARFGSLHQAMYTLFIALTQDGWAKVFNELSEVGLHVVGSIYFFFFIMIGAFVFMNIISGVIVTNFQRAHEEFNRARQLKFRILNAKDTDEKESEAHPALKTRLPTATELTQGQGVLPLSGLSGPGGKSERSHGGGTSAGKSGGPQATVQQVERFLFALSAIEANVAQYDILVDQLALKIESVNDFNRALSEQTSTRDFIQSSIVDSFVL